MLQPRVGQEGHQLVVGAGGVDLADAFDTRRDHDGMAANLLDGRIGGEHRRQRLDVFRAQFASDCGTGVRNGIGAGGIIVRDRVDAVGQPRISLRQGGAGCARGLCQHGAGGKHGKDRYTDLVLHGDSASSRCLQGECTVGEARRAPRNTGTPVRTGATGLPLPRGSGRPGISGGIARQRGRPGAGYFFQ
ncbi:hypothetical protein D9M68_550630 [compost metagenome]